MINILIDPNNICLAKYVDVPIVSSTPRIKIGVVCGNCNLSFGTNNYMLENGRRRYIANCPHCGKWNKMNLFTEDYRDIYQLF